MSGKKRKKAPRINKKFVRRLKLFNFFFFFLFSCIFFAGFFRFGFGFDVHSFNLTFPSRKKFNLNGKIQHQSIWRIGRLLVATPAYVVC